MSSNPNRADGSEAPSVRAGRFTDQYYIHLAETSKDPQTQLGLSMDASEQIRMALAYNPYIGLDIVSRLSEDSSERIRGIIAMRSDISRLMLLELAQDESSDA